MTTGPSPLPAAEDERLPPDLFRAVFRGHPAGVVVVTADAGDGPAGFTATSLASVSLDPPLLSFALARTASAWPALRDAGTVVVNFLDARHQHVARTFAASGVDRFAPPTRWFRLPSGEPALSEAPVRVRAAVEARHAAGDHTIVVARALGAALERREPPLVYHDGRYLTAR
ncbi:flavin reductase family protein [Vallicoccus soli]|uniref:Flavin reductase n=1 Tax=Vallicoccus soli TaxID=2339232 RepID=A0A3A3Z4I5_9ACTN|nr:flavin reductase family protein [Vallicoccus soli]RJK95457.1 flavin reductase [Vallicoccus soli]